MKIADNKASKFLIANILITACLVLQLLANVKLLEYSTVLRALSASLLLTLLFSKRDVPTNTNLLGQKLLATIAFFLLLRNFFLNENQHIFLQSLICILNILVVMNLHNYIGKIRIFNVLVTSLFLFGFIQVLRGFHLQQCSASKCERFGLVLNFGLMSENTIGFFVALMLLVKMFRPIHNKYKDSLVLVFLLVLLLATFSRTSMLAISVALIMKRLIDAHFYLISKAIFVFIVGTTTLVPFLTSSAHKDLFSGRENIWRQIIQLPNTSPLGFGGNRYSVFQDQRLLPLHWPHSQAMYIYFSIGVVGLIFWTFTLVLMGLQNKNYLITLSFFCTWGTSEVWFNPLTFDYSLIMFFLTVNLARSLEMRTQR